MKLAMFLPIFFSLILIPIAIVQEQPPKPSSSEDFKPTDIPQSERVPYLKQYLSDCKDECHLSDKDNMNMPKIQKDDSNYRLYWLNPQNHEQHCACIGCGFRHLHKERRGKMKQLLDNDYLSALLTNVSTYFDLVADKCGDELDGIAMNLVKKIQNLLDPQVPHIQQVEWHGWKTLAIVLIAVSALLIVGNALLIGGMVYVRKK